MDYRLIGTEDIAQIAAWNIELHEDEGSIPMTGEQARQRLRDWFASGTFQGLIVSLDGVDLGYVLYEIRSAGADPRDPRQSVYLRQFYISRKHRRNGIGTEVFGHLRAEFGTTSITLEVKATNPGGQKFWESLGFVPQEIVYRLG